MLRAHHDIDVGDEESTQSLLAAHNRDVYTKLG